MSSCLCGSNQPSHPLLTFDDGPHPTYTPQVLDRLAATGTKALFFLLGNACREHPALVQRIRQEGHIIGIHGMDHSRHHLARQARQCHQILGEMGIKTRLFRPPCGRIGLCDAIQLILRGYRIIIWSVDSHDSMRHEGKWPEPMPEYRQLRPDDIILLHDDNPACLEHLNRIPQPQTDS